MKAEQTSHEEHDTLISPRRNLANTRSASRESQGQEAEGAEDRDDEKKEKDRTKRDNQRERNITVLHSLRRCLEQCWQ